MFATGTLGAVFVPLHLRFPPSNLQWVLEDTGCSVLVYSAENSDTVEMLRPRVPVRRYLQVGLPNTGARRTDMLLEELLVDQPETPIDEQVELSDPCLIAYT